MVFLISRRHKRFIKSFGEKIQYADMDVEKTVADWKKYLEKLEQVPYSKLTSKEIFKITSDNQLKDELGIIDRFIYATAEKPATKSSFDFLLNFAEARYRLKIDQIKHG